MIHCTPVVESERSPCSWGIAIATIVWSMKVIDTARIIPARIRFLRPVPASSMPRLFATGTGNPARPVVSLALMPSVFWIGLAIAGLGVLIGLLSGARSRSTGALTGLAIGAFLGVMAGFPLLALGLATS
jgi:hypothetical protein